MYDTNLSTDPVITMIEGHRSLKAPVTEATALEQLARCDAFAVLFSQSHARAAEVRALVEPLLVNPAYRSAFRPPH